MVRQINVRELARRLDEGEPTLLLDVRQPWEHETAVLPGSQLLPLDQLLPHHGELEIPRDAFVVVYCHHGIRSLSGAALLEQQGYHNVASLQGGIDAWSLYVDPSVPRY